MISSNCGQCSKEYVLIPVSEASLHYTYNFLLVSRQFTVFTLLYCADIYWLDNSITYSYIFSVFCVAICQTISQSWGGKENGFGLAECCQDLPIQVIWSRGKLMSMCLK